MSDLIKIKDEILKRLKVEIDSNPLIGNVSSCVDETEIFSFLREMIFRTDAKTNTFLNDIKKSFDIAVAADLPKISELEMNELLLDSLKKCATKNSKLKITKSYFSPENDLVIKLSKEGRTETVFRVLSVKG